MKKSILFFSFFILLGIITKAQNNEILAKSYYYNAEEYYQQNKYELALTNLEKAIETLGETNPKIQYLKVKSLYSLKRYKEAKSAIDKYFKIAKDENSEKYQELVKLYTKIDTEQEEQKKELELKKQEEEYQKALLIAKQEEEKKRKELEELNSKLQTEEYNNIIQNKTFVAKRRALKGFKNKYPDNVKSAYIDEDGLLYKRKVSTLAKKKPYTGYGIGLCISGGIISYFYEFEIDVPSGLYTNPSMKVDAGLSEYGFNFFYFERDLGLNFKYLYGNTSNTYSKYDRFYNDYATSNYFEGSVIIRVFSFFHIKPGFSILMVNNNSYKNESFTRWMFCINPEIKIWRLGIGLDVAIPYTLRNTQYLANYGSLTTENPKTFTGLSLNYTIGRIK